jgi:hypothetical protein
MDNARQFARAEHSCPGELVAKGGGMRRLAITVRSVSARGLGGEILGAAAAGLARGTPITVHLPGPDHELVLPGAIAWTDPGPTRIAEGRVGIRLLLELAPASERRRFSHWLRRVAAANE